MEPKQGFRDAPYIDNRWDDLIEENKRMLKLAREHAQDMERHQRKEDEKIFCETKENDRLTERMKKYPKL